MKYNRVITNYLNDVLSSSKKSLVALLIGAPILLFASFCFADNPLVSHVFTADPAARVFNDRVYVVTSHDKDGATGYDLTDYFLFSSDDMVNWQDHGIIFTAGREATWAGQAYAPDFIERNGKYYLIFPNGASSIGILVAEKPEGPYTDLIGRALITSSTPNSAVQWLFDPGVFMDDDGTVYVYFGGGGPGNARVIKLADDLKSTVGAAVTIDAPYFFEAPYMHKKNGVYYFSYSTNGDNGSITIDYMTANNPMTGFTHRGTVIPNPWSNLGNNNHHSLIEYQDQWYAFYHNRAVSNRIYERSICVDLLAYNSDGTMQKVIPTAAGVPKIKNFDPFRRVEAETMDSQSGVETEKASEGSMDVMFDTNDWIKVANVDFGAGATFFEARIAAQSNTSLEIILDGINNSPAATLQIAATGGMQSWQTQTSALAGINGLHDVYFRAKGRLNFNWYAFTGRPKDCGSEAGSPVCCDISADIDRDGWGEQVGKSCKVTSVTEGYNKLNGADIIAAINVGGNVGDYYNDIYYQPDLYYQDGQPHSTSDFIIDGGNSALFQSERYGSFSYAIPVENGDYTVALHFTEMYHEVTGGRVFGVSVENNNVLSNFDLFDEVGHDSAYTFANLETRVSDGILSIAVSTSVDNGTLSGILVQSKGGVSSASSSNNTSSTSSSSSSVTPGGSAGAFNGLGVLIFGGLVFLRGRRRP